VIKDDHPPALLDVRGVTKSFAGVPALRGVDLDILPGEVHCILGRTVRASRR
jgi:ribose transport system ATP-binding protein